MREIFIEGAKLTDRESTYNYLYDVLDSVFAKNLDALYDVLTDLCDCEITFSESSAVLKNLGDYGERVIACFKDADEENENLKVNFI